MTNNSKIDKLLQILYGLVPVVERVEKNMETVQKDVGAVNVRLAFIETTWGRLDERVASLEKHNGHKFQHGTQRWRLKMKDMLEVLAALPVAAHLIPSILLFLGALATFIHEYIKMHPPIPH